MIDKRIEATCRKIVFLLSEKRYKEIADLSNGYRLSAEEMSCAVEEYGRILTPLPDQGIELIRVFKVEDSEHPRWAVDVPLWSKEEGRSDLTLSMSLVDVGVTDLAVEIDDLHVL